MQKKNEDTVQLTARIPSELHKRLRFIAADEHKSLNDTFIQLLQEATEGRQIAVPSGLLSRGQTR